MTLRAADTPAAASAAALVAAAAEIVPVVVNLAHVMVNSLSNTSLT